MAATCFEFREEISCLIDGELEQYRRSALEQHLATCSACRQSHEQFQGLGGLLQQSSKSIQAQAPDLVNLVVAALPSVCQCIEDDLSAYLDGELIAPAKEGVSEHLERCADCLAKFNELTKVNSLLAKGLVLPASVEVDIWSGVNSRLNDDCLLIKSELSAFIDREVATLRHRAITAHLTECAECSLEFNQLSQAGDMLRTYYQPPADAAIDLWSGVKGKMNVVAFEPQDKRKTVYSMRRLYATAAAVLAGVAASSAFFWYGGGHSSTAQMQPVTAEAYLIDQSLGDPADSAEAVVYERSD